MLERGQENLIIMLDNPTDAAAYSKLLLKIADNCTSNIPVQQYVFTRVEEVLAASEEQKRPPDSNASLFATSENGRANDGPFIRALHSTDAYSRQSASVGLAHLLSRLSGDDKSFCLWISEQLTAGSQSQSQSNTVTLDHALTALTVLLRKRSARLVFLDTGGIKLLSNVLTTIGPNGNAQHIYELCFALWTISLSYTLKGEDYTQGPSAYASMVDASEADGREEDVDYKLFLSAGTIPLLSELISAAPSRKVVRMCLACLRNLGTFIFYLLRLVDSFHCVVLFLCVSVCFFCLSLSFCLAIRFCCVCCWWLAFCYFVSLSSHFCIASLLICIHIFLSISSCSPTRSGRHSHRDVERWYRQAARYIHSH